MNLLFAKLIEFESNKLRQKFMFSLIRLLAITYLAGVGLLKVEELGTKIFLGQANYM